MLNVYHTCGLPKSTVNYFCRLVNDVEILAEFQPETYLSWA